MLGFETDRIKDFKDGLDEIDLSAFGFSNATESKSFASNQSGNATFDFGGVDILIVENILKGALTGADFTL